MANRKYNLNFTFCETEEEAIVACLVINHEMTPYCRKRYPAHYTPWKSKDGKTMFVVLFHAKF